MHFVSLAAMSYVHFWAMLSAVLFGAICMASYRLAAFCCLQRLCQCTCVCVTALACVLVDVVCLTECRQRAHIQCLDQWRSADEGQN
jgi:uncharacterized membrane protein